MRSDDARRNPTTLHLPAHVYKAKPGVLNYGIGNYGGSPHLAGELFKAMSQTNIVTVPYTGTPRAMVGLLGGEVQLMFPGAQRPDIAGMEAFNRAFFEADSILLTTLTPRACISRRC